jgi:glycosyltransferase involved in cell wall biosynthesis
MADLSVVVPNYNHAGLLPRALDALLAQGVRPREILVVDDASTDDSRRVIEGYARRHDLVRPVWADRNAGVEATLNRGAALAAGRFVYLTAADDYVLPGFFEKTLEVLGRHPAAGLCRANDSFRVGDGPVEPNPAGWGDQPGYLTPDEVAARLRHTIPGHATVVRKDAFLRVGGLRPALRWYSDWFANLAVAFRDGACHVPEALAIRVLLPGNYSAGAKAGPEHVAVLAEVLRLLTTPGFADVAPYFRRNGALTFFGPDLIRAAARRPDLWHPDVLGFLNGFRPEQYEELLTDPDPTVRAVAEFFLGPFWREAAERRAQAEYQLARLRDELEQARRQLPPAGAAAKLRWLAGRAAGRVFRTAG